MQQKIKLKMKKFKYPPLDLKYLFPTAEHRLPPSPSYTERK